VLTELERVWADRTPDGGDPRPGLADELYAWISAAGPTPQEPDEAAAALVELIATDDPPLCVQSGPASLAYTTGALREPSRATELASVLAVIDAAQGR
jgi:hypothetical protein